MAENMIWWMADILHTLFFVLCYVGVLIYNIVRRKKIEKRKCQRWVIVCSIGILLGGSNVFINCMDIGAYKNNDFIYMEGDAWSNWQGDGNDYVVSVKIRDKETRKIVRVQFYYAGGEIKEWDRIKVKYLPHSKAGVLLELNGEVLAK